MEYLDERSQNGVDTRCPVASRAVHFQIKSTSFIHGITLSRRKQLENTCRRYLFIISIFYTNQTRNKNCGVAHLLTVSSNHVVSVIGTPGRYLLLAVYIVLLSCSSWREMTKRTQVLETHHDTERSTKASSWSFVSTGEAPFHHR